VLSWSLGLICRCYWLSNETRAVSAGKEALPHVDFWTRALPTAVMDGILFTRMQLSARFGSGSGGENYTKVGEGGGAILQPS
jgi:hypothetical protein